MKFPAGRRSRRCRCTARCQLSNFGGTREPYLDAGEAQFLDELSLEICYYTLECTALDSLLLSGREVLFLASLLVLGLL